MAHHWLFQYDEYCGKILHSFEDQKFVNFFNPEQVNFRVTLVIYV